MKGETLESVSSCTRFSGFLTISSFGFNCLSSKLVSMFFGIVPMLNVRTQGFCFGLLRRADMRELRHARTFWRKSARRSNPEQNPLVQTLELSQKTCLPILSSNG